MAIEAGQQLLHYRLVEKIGEGGMGVVWKAVDTKLDREVAIKVLPEEVAADAERLTRFEREAKLLASLNHPNIAVVHALDQAEGGPDFLAMELVPGEDLAERVARGPIPLKEVLATAQQVALALEAAHTSGVVHRDLKPANIRLTPQGQVKVLDFGLAKVLEPVGSSGATVSPSLSPTLTSAGTRAGMILGTAAYMSPEQARGQEVDRRADIWALGCVLYEMLTGASAFRGPTVSDTLASVLKEAPDWERLPTETPVQIRRLLHRCLEKDPDRRLHDIADARIEIEDALSGREWTIDPDASAGPRVHPWRRHGWTVATLSLILVFIAIATVAVTAVWSPWKSIEQPQRISARLSIVLPPDAPLAPTGSMPLSVGQPSLALSPDGRNLVYVALCEGTRQLYRRDMVTGAFHPIPGTDRARSPFFSPDSQWVAFFADDALKKVSLAGGEPVPLAGVEVLTTGGVWGFDDSIYFTREQNGEIWRVSANGGSARAVTSEDNHAWPSIPATMGETETLLVSLDAGGSRSAVGIVKLQTADRRSAADEQSTLGEQTQLGLERVEILEQSVVLEPGSFARYLPTGHLLYVTPGVLMAVRFDPKREEIDGPSLTIVDDIQTETMWSAQVAVSSEGTLVYAKGDHTPRGSFVWVDRQGTREEVGIPYGLFSGDFKLSPDGNYLGYTVDDIDGRDLWVYEIARGVATRFTHGGNDRSPIWLPGSESFFYTSTTSEGRKLVWQPTDRGREPIRFPEEIPSAKAIGYISERNELVIQEAGMLHVVSVGNDQNPSAEAELVKSIPSQGMFFPSLSPDGRWLAYTWKLTGRWEVFVSSFPELVQTKQISVSGGEEPRWRGDGREIVYRWGSKWFSVDVDAAAEIEVGPPRLLFEGPYVNLRGFEWDMSPDGQRFLVIENPEQDRPKTELIVITNFFDEIERLLPSDN